MGIAGVATAGAQATPDLIPFFDRRASTEAAPPPPQLSAFDEAVLIVCGDWGSRPSARAFRGLLDDPTYRRELVRIYDRLDRSLDDGALSLDVFKAELTDAWFDEQGFRHIFCGEPRNDELDGLHFAGRYLDIQELGWGGLSERCSREEIAPPIFTFGMVYLAPDESFALSCPKGYAYDLDAVDLLVEATQALKDLRRSEDGDAMCLHRVESGDYLAVFVMHDGAIRTFYPDASPRCEGGAPARSCLCSGQAADNP